MRIILPSTLLSLVAATSLVHATSEDPANAPYRGDTQTFLTACTYKPNTAKLLTAYTCIQGLPNAVKLLGTSNLPVRDREAIIRKIKKMSPFFVSLPSYFQMHSNYKHPKFQWQQLLPYEPMSEIRDLAQNIHSHIFALINLPIPVDMKTAEPFKELVEHFNETTKKLERQIKGVIMHHSNKNGAITSVISTSNLVKTNSINPFTAVTLASQCIIATVAQYIDMKAEVISRKYRKPLSRRRDDSMSIHEDDYMDTKCLSEWYLSLSRSDEWSKAIDSTHKEVLIRVRRLVTKLFSLFEDAELLSIDFESRKEVIGKAFKSVDLHLRKESFKSDLTKERRSIFGYAEWLLTWDAISGKPPPEEAEYLAQVIATMQMLRHDVRATSPEAVLQHFPKQPLSYPEFTNSFATRSNSPPSQHFSDMALSYSELSNPPAMKPSHSSSFQHSYAGRPTSRHRSLTYPTRKARLRHSYTVQDIPRFSDKVRSNSADSIRRRLPPLPIPLQRYNFHSAPVSPHSIHPLDQHKEISDHNTLPPLNHDPSRPTEPQQIPGMRALMQPPEERHR